MPGLTQRRRCPAAPGGMLLAIALGANGSLRPDDRACRGAGAGRRARHFPLPTIPVLVYAFYSFVRF